MIIENIELWDRNNNLISSCDQDWWSSALPNWWVSCGANIF